MKGKRSLDKVILALASVAALVTATPRTAKADPFDSFRFSSDYVCQLSTDVGVSKDDSTLGVTPNCGGRNYMVISPIVYSEQNGLQGSTLIFAYSLDHHFGGLGKRVKLLPALATSTDPDFNDLSAGPALFGGLSFYDNALLLEGRFGVSFGNVLERNGTASRDFEGAFSPSVQVLSSGKNALRFGAELSDGTAKDLNLRGYTWVDTTMGGNYAYLRFYFEKGGAGTKLAMHF